MSGEGDEGSELKLVQRLAASGGAPPDRYVLHPETRPDSDPPLASDIPVIDLRRLVGSGEGQEAEADKLRSALQSLGLFQLIGHDLSPLILDEVRDVAKDLFQLPMEVKQKYSNLKDGKFDFEGYGNDFVATEDQVIDWNDRLYLLVQPEDKRKLDYWPDNLNPCNFRDILNKYTMQTRKLTETVLLALAKLLNLDENYFIDQLDDKAEVFARFNYYPYCSQPDLVFGIKPHTDGSVMTIVLPDKEVDGLQVLKDGDWVKVPIVPCALLINMGNQMEIMSNGIFKSPEHRVVASSKERISVAMFYSLESEKILEPAEGLVDETRPCLYRKMKTKDFLQAFYKRFTQGENTIDWLRVDQDLKS